VLALERDQRLPDRRSRELVLRAVTGEPLEGLAEVHAGHARILRRR
jgi:hypothetical protein